MAVVSGNNYNNLQIRFPQNGTHCIFTLKFINVASGCYSVVFYIHNHLVVQKGFEDTKLEAVTRRTNNAISKIKRPTKHYTES